MRWSKKKMKNGNKENPRKKMWYKMRKMSCDREGWMYMSEVEKWRWFQTNEQTYKQKQVEDVEMVQNERQFDEEKGRKKMNEHIAISKTSFMFGFHDARHATHTLTWKQNDGTAIVCVAHHFQWSLLVRLSFLLRPSHPISGLWTKFGSNPYGIDVSSGFFFSIQFVCFFILSFLHRIRNITMVPVNCVFFMLWMTFV